MNHPVTITSNRRIGVRVDIIWSIEGPNIHYHAALPDKEIVGQRYHMISRLDEHGYGHGTFIFDGVQWQQI